MQGLLGQPAGPAPAQDTVVGAAVSHGEAGFTGSGVDFALARFDSIGQPDASFGTGGKQHTPLKTGSGTDVLREAHNIRLARGAYNISDEHLADAIELLAKKPAADVAKRD